MQGEKNSHGAQGSRKRGPPSGMERTAFASMVGVQGRGTLQRVDRGKCRRGRASADGTGQHVHAGAGCGRGGQLGVPWHTRGDHFYPFILRPLPSAVPALTHPAISEMSL